ncbi:MAG: S46 family peptidase [Bacteroidota bacterium]
MKKFLFLSLLMLVRLTAFADEGMWLPIFLKQLNEPDMKAKGMRISAEDIYSVNQSSMKDAVVLFGGGCTGEIISDKGLLLTNHHCGFSQIQSHSSLENDYLKYGFWAMTQEQELACPGLTATFIIRIEDVTAQIIGKLAPEMTEAEREKTIKDMSGLLEKKATEGTHYGANVRPFFNGNQFYLFVTETFKDVRMVGAPPSSIGKFGGDTDNWMWPRHTGDFALFRVYAGPDNKPAEYSKDNVPFKPRHHFPISLKGVQPGDFTMVYGFPGRTTQYISSYAVKNTMEVNNPARIAIRTARLEIIDDAMRSSDKLRIQYAAKQASIANAWKKWQGEQKGLNRLNTIQNKLAFEKSFNEWAKLNGNKEYINILDLMRRQYEELAPFSKAIDYINEAAYGAEMLRYATAFNKLESIASAKPYNEKAVSEEAARLLNTSGGFYKDFDAGTDQKLFVAMMGMYFSEVDPAYHPAELINIQAKYKGDFGVAGTFVYSKSFFSDSLKLQAFLTGFSSKKLKQLQSDPAYKLAMSFRSIYKLKLESPAGAINADLTILNRKYMAAQMEMEPTKRFYPDANSTLRVAYGQVEGYEAADATYYNHMSTIEGIMQKENPAIEEFEVPKKLKDLYTSRDFGDYAVNGTLPVAFVASNHTTGGNSGSPVLNANGELIGTNFDRVWEGTMSDIDFDPEKCRNISLDIRFTLFVIDKFAGCKRLVDEMKIVR